MPQVHVLIPFTSHMSPETEQWLWALAGANEDVRIDKIRHQHVGFVYDVRQEQCDRFLAGPCDWALFLDSDTAPLLTPKQILDGARAIHASVVSGMTMFHWKYRPGFHANVFLRREKHGLVPLLWHKEIPWGEGRYLPVDAAGLSCLLIRRGVLEDLIKRSETLGEPYPFMPVNEKGHVIVREDMAFSMRLEAAGHKMYADLQALCIHKGIHPNSGVFDLPAMSPGEEPHPNAPVVIDPARASLFMSEDAPKEKKLVELVN